MEAMPNAVFVLWWVGLALAAAVFVPLSVYLLHRTWRAARMIHRYSAEALVAAGGIAGATAQIGALDATIEVAGDMLASSDRVAQKLDTIASVLEDRAQGNEGGGA